MALIEIGKVIFLLAFPHLEALRDYWIFPVKIEVSQKWHTCGFAIRALTAFCLIAPFWTWMPLYGFYFWICFDEWTGVGHTAAIDKIPHTIYYKIIGLVLSGFLPLLM